MRLTLDFNGRRDQFQFELVEIAGNFVGILSKGEGDAAHQPRLPVAP